MTPNKKPTAATVGLEQRFDTHDFTTHTAPEPSATDPVEIARNRLREVVLLCGLPVHQAVSVFAAADMLARVLADERSKAGAA